MNNIPPKSIFLPKKKYRQEVKYSGVTLNNDSYLPGTKLMNNFTFKQYEQFAVDFPPTTANQASFSSVCDKEFVYWAWEVGSKDLESYLQSGTNWEGWGIYFNLINYNECILVKQSRETGKIVLAKRLSDITGIPTTNPEKYETTGDDICRGPFALYDNHLYTCGHGQRYPSIMKIRTDDFKLVWRTVVTEGNQHINIPGQPELSVAGLMMRQIIVIPPNKHRCYPLVIASSVSALSYCTISTETLFKLFNYYNGSGKVYGYKDNGNTVEFLWDYSSAPNPYKEGQKLSSNSFGNEVDEIKIYYPLTPGYQFKNGDSIKGIENTAGTFNLLTGSFTEDNSWEYGKFTFQPNTVFDDTLSYNCVVQNGSRRGQTISVPGSNLYIRATITETQQYQPVVKTLYRSQVGSKILDKYEAYELTHRCGGVYFNFCYEKKRDVIIFGTGNYLHVPYNIINDNYIKLNGSNPDPYITNNPLVNGETNARKNSGIYQKLPDIINEDVVAQTRLRQYKYWDDCARLRDTANYGADYNRAFFDCCVGLKCSDGSVQFALKTNRIDCVDHSITIGKSKTKNSIFYPNGNNQDVTGGTIAKFKNYKIGDKTISGKFLLVISKARLFIFDYNKLFDKIKGINPFSRTFSEGIISNTAFEDALIWEQKEGSTDQIGCLRCFAFDGKTLIKKSTGNNQNDFSKEEFPCEVFERGLEVHGLMFSPGIPNMASYMVAYDIPKIIHYRHMSYKDAVSWFFSNDKIFGAGESGTIGMYGDYCFFGTKSGYGYILKTKNGKIEKILYNDEGFPTCPVIADGIIWAYGGNNKWTPASVNNYVFASKICMWTPIGK
jgi:hypothetical protein